MLNKMFGSFKKNDSLDTSGGAVSPGNPKKIKPNNDSASSQKSSNGQQPVSPLLFQKEKTKVIKKSYSELNNLVLVQEIKCGNDAIWVIKFRQDGMYCAVGGNDGILRVYKTSEGTDKSKNFSH